MGDDSYDDTHQQAPVEELFCVITYSDWEHFRNNLKLSPQNLEIMFFQIPLRFK